jgi:2-polyprenyl-3-methyl-5-hydroxy-6-metoxy-1,4-benzoquinol methylase
VQAWLLLQGNQDKDDSMNKNTTCWCGNGVLQDYSPTYALCPVCSTLVLKEWPFEDPTHVDDQGELYGKDYFLKHLPESYGFPSLYERARLDLTDRVPHWLRTMLKYALPPASVLELGSAHGGFIAFLRSAGYQAMGLELSPWLVEFAQETFGIQMLRGPLESQDVQKGSLDVVAHMDVLEHLPDPVGTMRIALDLLKPGGFMLLQTPHFEPEKTYDELKSSQHPFLTHFKELEHLFLFSKQSLVKFFHGLGWEHVQFEPAIFSNYDMFAVISRQPLRAVPLEDQVKALQSLPSGRIVLALLDLYNRAEALQFHADARLKIVKEQEVEMEMLRKAAQERLDLINKLNQKGKK